MGTKVITDPLQALLAEALAGKTDQWSELAASLAAEIRRRFAMGETDLDRPRVVGIIEGELERTWDAGNASGLDGWIGPGRGAGEVDDYAVSQRQRDTSGALGRIVERLYPVKHPTQ